MASTIDSATPRTPTSSSTATSASGALDVAGALVADTDAAPAGGGVRPGRFRRPGRRARRQPPRQPRRHHGVAQPFDRLELESAGWRTTLEYRENHARGRDGSLECLEVVWYAEAERVARNGVVAVVSATARSPERAWSRLRAEADLVEVRAGRAAVASP